MANFNVKMIFDLIDNASPGLAKLQTSMSLLSELGKGLAGALAVPVGVGGFAALTQSAINLGDEINKMSDKTGIGAESLSGLAYNAQLADVEFSQIAQSAKTLSKNLTEAQVPGSKAAQIFKDLGINTKNSNGQLKSMDEVLLDLADVFSTTENDANKMRVATELLGKAGLDMIPMLNQGRDAMKAMSDEAKGFGVFWSADKAKQADQFNDNLTRIKNIVMGLFTQIAQYLLPTLNVLSEAFISSAKEGGFVKGAVDAIVVSIKILNEILKPLYILINAVINGFTTFGKIVGIIAGAIAAAARGDMQSAGQVFNLIGDAVAESGQEFKKFVTDLYTYEDASKKAGEETKKGTVKYNAQAEAIKKAKDELDKYIAALNLQANSALAVNEAEKKMMEAEAKIMEQLKSGNITEEQAIAYLNQAYAAIEAERANKEFVKSVRDGVDAMRERNKENIKAESDGQKWLTQQSQVTDLIEYENTLVGMSNDEKRIALDLRRLENTEMTVTSDALADLIAKRRAALTVRQTQNNEDKLLSGTYQKQREQFERDKAVIQAMYDSGRISLETMKEAMSLLPESALTNQERMIKTMHDKLKEGVGSLQNVWEEGFFAWMQGKSFNLADAIKTAMDRMIANMLAAQMQMALFGSGPNMAGGLFSGIFGGFRASGGPVSAGKAYVVGEKRPEIFVPNTSGTILPSTNIAAPSSNQVMVNITAMDSQDVKRALERDKRWISDLVMGTAKNYNLQGGR